MTKVIVVREDCREEDARKCVKRWNRNEERVESRCDSAKISPERDYILQIPTQ